MPHRPARKTSKPMVRKSVSQKNDAQRPVNPRDTIPGGLERLSASERARVSGQDPRNKREPKAQRIKDELRDAKQGLFVRVAEQQGFQETK